MTREGATRISFQDRLGIPPAPLGVLGCGIDYTLSPTIHTYWLQFYNFPQTYGIYDRAEKDLPQLILAFQESDWVGANVTIPYKKKILSWIDVQDQTVQITQSANTLKQLEDGRIAGFNTDVMAFYEALGLACQEMGHTLIKTATVLGAGGAARAACYALLRMGVQEIRVVARDPMAAYLAFKTLPKQIQFYNWLDIDQAFLETQVLVNATPLGQAGGASLLVDLRGLAPKSIVVDYVYTPIQTPFLEQAKSLGFLTITGLELLLLQAKESFFIWFDRMPQVTNELKNRLAQALRKKG